MVESADVLLENEYLRVEAYRGRRVIAVRRSAKTFEPAATATAYRDALSFITPEHRTWGMVIDVRETPGINDAGFESAVAPVADRVTESFARVVFLLRTAVGGLQMERLRRERGVALRYTQDEDEAFAIAAGERA